MITAHDHSDANPSPIMTTFTTQSAAMNRWTMLKVSGVIAALGSMGLRVGGRGRRMAQADGETMARTGTCRALAAPSARAADGMADHPGRYRQSPAEPRRSTRLT